MIQAQHIKASIDKFMTGESIFVAATMNGLTSVELEDALRDLLGGIYVAVNSPSLEVDILNWDIRSAPTEEQLKSKEFWNIAKARERSK